ncbi:hypothetical protein, partial [Streptococcus dysgalactiae]|uniref:hypothetical protein n=1 Tax=Streptococcus dysgalactiae TaxID=1334 RepID=UPI002729CBA1
MNGMTSEKLAPVKKLPSQATFKFCFQLTVVIASSLIGHHLLSKIPLTIIPQFPDTLNSNAIITQSLYKST